MSRGDADVYSDVDIHCLITDDSSDWFRDHWDQTAGHILPVLMHQSIPGVTGGFVLSPEWQHLDLIFTAVSAFHPDGLTEFVPLFDREGRLPHVIASDRSYGVAESRADRPVLLHHRQPGGDARARRIPDRTLRSHRGHRCLPHSRDDPDRRQCQIRGREAAEPVPGTRAPSVPRTAPTRLGRTGIDLHLRLTGRARVRPTRQSLGRTIGHRVADRVGARHRRVIFAGTRVSRSSRRSE